MTEMTTTMTEIGEVDMDELAGVEGGGLLNEAPGCGTPNLPLWNKPHHS